MPRRAVSSVFRDVTLRSGTMPRKSIGERPMTDAERQARRRAARAAGVPVIRARRPLDRRSRAQRWRDAVAELTVLQDQYAAWLAALPGNLQDSAIANALQAICDLDLGDLQAIDLPRGFGRDRPSRQTPLRSLRRWVHRNPRAPLRQPLDGHSAARGSPYGLPAQAVPSEAALSHAATVSFWDAGCHSRHASGVHP
jgi:hypothetical protein